MNPPKEANKSASAKPKARAPKTKTPKARALRGTVVAKARAPSRLNQIARELTYSRAVGQGSSRAAAFWNFVGLHQKMTEAERLRNIQGGLSVEIPYGLRDALDINASVVAKLLNISTSTLERRIKSEEPLGQVASERLDRIAQITSMAEDVLESREEAARWLTRAHSALRDQAPITLCDTEIGARQVRRILSAIEWGNAA